MKARYGFSMLGLVCLTILAAGCPGTNPASPSGPTFTPTLSGTPTTVPQPTSTFCPGFGTTESGSYSGGVGGSANRLAKHVLATTSAVTAVSFPIHIETYSAGYARAGIYSDLAGTPGVLLTESLSVVPQVVEGWNTVPVSMVVLAPGTYWLAAMTDTNGTYNFLTTSETPGLAATGNWSGGLPDPFTGGFATSYAWAFKALCGPLPTATPTQTETGTFTSTLTVTPSPTLTNTPWPTPVETNSWATGQNNGGIHISGSDLYLGAYSSGQIQKLNLVGAPNPTWVPPSVNQPVAIQTDASGNIYVGTNLTDNIRVFNSQATPIATMSPSASYLGLTENGPGTIVANDPTNNRIRFFSTSTFAQVGEWAIPGLNWGIARDSNLLYAAGYINSYLRLYLLDGSSGGANWPTPAGMRAVVVDSNHRVYTAGNGGPISRYSQSGVLEVQWGNYNCIGLAIDSNNNLYLSELSNSIRVFSP